VSFKFLLPGGEIAKSDTDARVIRCGLLPRAPLNKPVQAHHNP
jgi:hypothetical protein